MRAPGQSLGPHGRGGDQGGGAGEGEGQDVAARDVEEMPRLPGPERAAGGPPPILVTPKMEPKCRPWNRSLTMAGMREAVTE